MDGKGIADLAREAYKKSDMQFMVVVSSIGVGRPWALPAGILNLFGAVLLFKDYSEQVVRKEAEKYEKGYLIVRPGGMERPTDDYGNTHQVRLEGRNSLGGGNVSNLQVAQLIADAVVKRSEQGGEQVDGRTVEMIAETEAPKKDTMELLAEVRTP